MPSATHWSRWPHVRSGCAGCRRVMRGAEREGRAAPFADDRVAGRPQGATHPPVTHSGRSPSPDSRTASYISAANSPPPRQARRSCASPSSTTSRRRPTARRPVRFLPARAAHHGRPPDVRRSVRLAVRHQAGSTCSASARRPVSSSQRCGLPHPTRSAWCPVLGTARLRAQGPASTGGFPHRHDLTPSALSLQLTSPK